MSKFSLNAKLRDALRRAALRVPLLRGVGGIKKTVLANLRFGSREYEHLQCGNDIKTVVVTEAFNGKVKQFKNAVVVATR